MRVVCKAFHSGCQYLANTHRNYLIYPLPAPVPVSSVTMYLRIRMHELRKRRWTHWVVHCEYTCLSLPGQMHYRSREKKVLENESRLPSSILQYRWWWPIAINQWGWYSVRFCILDDVSRAYRLKDLASWAYTQRTNRLLNASHRILTYLGSIRYE